MHARKCLFEYLQLFCLTFMERFLHDSFYLAFHLCLQLCLPFWADQYFAMNCWNNFFVTHQTLCMFCFYSYFRHLLVGRGLAINCWNNSFVTHPTLCMFCVYSYFCHLLVDCGTISLVLDTLRDSCLHEIIFLMYRRWALYQYARNCFVWLQLHEFLYLHLGSIYWCTSSCAW